MTVERPRGAACNDTGGPLVFVHIPKTAGTTLLTMLVHAHPPEAIHKVMMRGMSWTPPRHAFLPARLISASKLRRLKADLRKGRVRLIHGHFDLSLGRLLPPDARFVTLLRDPVERAVSHYWHYRTLRSDPAHQLALRSTLADWVSRCGLAEMDNGQTRRLAGAMRLPIGKLSSRSLESAKANLTRFAVVGLTERFEESQVLVQREFGWPYRRYPARNVGAAKGARPELGADVRKVIRDCNRLDLELYRFAAERFRQAAARIDMQRELALLRSAPLYADSGENGTLAAEPGSGSAAAEAPSPSRARRSGRG